MYIERTVRWISEIHPPYRDTIRGCSSEEIALLERAHGRELPAIYRELLALMGQDAALPCIFDAGDPTGDVDLSFTSILNASEGPGWPLASRFTRIGVHHGDVDHDFYGDFYLDEVPDESRPRVMRFAMTSDLSNLAEALAGFQREAARSLQDLVFASAIASHVFPRHAVRTLLGRSQSEIGLRQVDHAFDELRFTRHPALRATTRYHARDDAVALVHHHPGEVRIELHTQSLEAAHRIGAHLQAQGLVMHRPEPKRTRKRRGER